MPKRFVAPTNQPSLPAGRDLIIDMKRIITTLRACSENRRSRREEAHFFRFSESIRASLPRLLQGTGIYKHALRVCRGLLPAIVPALVTASRLAAAPGQPDLLSDHPELILSSAQDWGVLGFDTAAHAPNNEARRCRSARNDLKKVSAIMPTASSRPAR